MFMRYEIYSYMSLEKLNTTPATIHIYFDQNENIEDILILIATRSYEYGFERNTSFGNKRPDSTEADFENCIEYKNGKPYALKVEYIHNVDCRVDMIQGKHPLQWRFNALGFTQRGLTMPEFLEGNREYYATNFLDNILDELDNQNKSDVTFYD